MSSAWRAPAWAACAVCAGCIIPIGTNNLGGDGGTQDTSLVEKDVGVVTGTWTDVTANLKGLPSGCGNLTFLSSRADRDELIVGVAGNALYASSNGATNWTLLSQGDGGASIDNRPTQFVYDPLHPATFWVSGAYGTCVYRTTDDGASLTPLGTETHCDSVGVDFTDSARQTLLAGGHERHALYLSRDGGSTWNDISANLPMSAGSTGFAVVIGHDEFLVGTYYGATDGGPSDGIFRSTDGGAHWTLVHPGAVRSLPLMSSYAGGTIYWPLWAGAGLNGMVQSTDHGATWRFVAGSEPVAAESQQELAEMPDGRLIAMSGNNVIVSADHGASWTPEGPPIPVSPDGIAYSTFRNAIYVWHFDCYAGADPVPSQAVLRLDFR